MEKSADPFEKKYVSIYSIMVAMLLILGSTACSSQPTSQPGDVDLTDRFQSQVPQSQWFVLGDAILGIGDIVATLEGAPSSPYDVPDGEELPSTGFQAVMNTLRFTVSAVGPQAILTAAHTVWDQQEKEMRRVPEIRRIPLCCDIHPAYLQGDPSADIALCRWERDLSRPKYEAISLDPSRIAASKELFLTGFGCVKEASEGAVSGTPNGKLAKVVEPVGAGEHFIEVDSCLCQGDSGGPGFAFEPGPDHGANPGEVLPPADGRRWIVGVNAQNLCEVNQAEKGALTNTSSPEISRWIEAWAQGKAEGQKCGQGEVTQVCGVTLFRKDQEEAEVVEGLCNG